MHWLIWVLIAYVCGSIPFGLIIGLARGVDIRKHGSGNLGTTNVGRVLGKKWGILCFVLDVLKGFGPVLGAGLALGFAGRNDLATADAWRWLAVAVAAVVGHIFPVWLAFKGGKGVATGLGVLLAFWPLLTLPGVAAFVTWIVVVKIWRYVSLASIAGAVSLPIYFVIVSIFTKPPTGTLVAFLSVSVLLALLVVVRHRSNIARLRAGTESKIGMKSGGEMGEGRGATDRRKEPRGD